MKAFNIKKASNIYENITAIGQGLNLEEVCGDNRYGTHPKGLSGVLATWQKISLPVCVSMIATKYTSPLKEVRQVQYVDIEQVYDVYRFSTKSSVSKEHCLLLNFFVVLRLYHFWKLILQQLWNVSSIKI